MSIERQPDTIFIEVAGTFGAGIPVETDEWLENMKEFCDKLEEDYATAEAEAWESDRCANLSSIFTMIRKIVNEYRTQEGKDQEPILTPVPTELISIDEVDGRLYEHSATCTCVTDAGSLLKYRLVVYSDPGTRWEPPAYEEYVEVFYLDGKSFYPEPISPDYPSYDINLQ